MDFDALYNSLKQKGANPNPDWIRGKMVQSISNENAFLVYYITTDISETSLPIDILATNTSENGSIVNANVSITKNIVLQINEVVDISLPAENRRHLEVSPFGTLKLLLTDGTNNIVGVSKKPLKFLNPAIDPGAKLLLKAPLTMRYGVILLTPENTYFHGGFSPIIKSKRSDIFKKMSPLRRNQISQLNQTKVNQTKTNSTNNNITKKSPNTTKMRKVTPKIAQLTITEETSSPILQVTPPSDPIEKNNGNSIGNFLDGDSDDEIEDENHIGGIGKSVAIPTKKIEKQVISQPMPARKKAEEISLFLSEDESLESETSFAESEADDAVQEISKPQPK